jgi:hypothetical protein
MNFLPRALPLVLALAAPALAQEQDQTKDQTKHLLRFSFEPGTVVNQVMAQDMSMKMNMGAEDMVTKMTMQMFQRYTVKAVKGDTADIVQEITRVKAVMDNPMMQVNYDSADEDSDPGMLEGVADLVGQKISLKLSNTGQPSDIKMPEAFDASSGVDLEQMMQQAITALPEEAVAVGDTWTVNQEMPMGQMGAAEAKVTYKLMSVDDKHYVLEQKLAMNLDKLQMPPGMELEKVSASGNLVLNRANGLPKSMNLDMKMTMAGQIAMEMDMKVSMKPAQTDKKAPVTGPKKDTPMVCVISGEDAEGGPTATFGGQTVGFCCKRCKAKWDKMDDDARKQAIAKLGAGK